MMSERRVGRRIFSYDETLAIFPSVRSLTEDAQRRIAALSNRLGSTEDLEGNHEELEEAVQEIVDQWASEVTALGCEVKGLWLVDWDSGGGYYCWRHPEETVAHFHGYDDGFVGRVPIN